MGGAHMSKHVHSMLRLGNIYKCASCEFTCTRAALAYVNSRPGLHRAITGKPEVYNA
jgi:hypothetical protein